MHLRNIKVNLIKALILTAVLFSLPLSSKAMDKGYDGDKPLFVVISTDWCFACKLLEPTIEQLKHEYDGKVTFIKLDPTSDESLYAAQQLALNYGISEFFNNNRNAFPRVAVYCPGSLSPQKNLLGANQIDVYRGILNEQLASSNSICNVQGRPPSNSSEENAQTTEEPKQTEIISGRPDEPVVLNRPNESSSSGRPEELTFWTYGQPMPLNAYLRSLSLPTCSGGNQLLCTKDTGSSFNLPQAPSSSKPLFKPYDPNATRNEKGLHL